VPDSELLSGIACLKQEFCELSAKDEQFGLSATSFLRRSPLFSDGNPPAI
jgi:hypothetical protein